MPTLDFVVGERLLFLRPPILLLNRFWVLFPDYFGEVLVISPPVPIIENPFSFVFKYSSFLHLRYLRSVISYRKCADFWTCVWRILITGLFLCIWRAHCIWNSRSYQFGLRIHSESPRTIRRAAVMWSKKLYLLLFFIFKPNEVTVDEPKCSKLAGCSA
jgi:hypothetical protein